MLIITPVTMKEVIEFADANGAVDTASMEMALESLVSRCIEADDAVRLSSLTIIDELRHCHGDTQSNGNLLSDAVHKVLIFDTEGNSNKRKRLRAELSDLVLLCRRLLEVGSDPNVRLQHEASVLDLAISFLNGQLEVFGLSQIPGQSSCPAWKLSLVEILVHHLSGNGAHASIQRYKLGPRSVESFCAESKLRRTEILLEVLEPKIVVTETLSKPLLVTWLAKTTDYKTLLKL